MQNGLVFFFVLAVASKLTFSDEVPEESRRSIYLSPAFIRVACAVGVVACLGLIGYSMVRVTSSALTAKANQTTDLGAATELYSTAMRLDDENPDPRNNYGLRLIMKKRYGDAIPFLQESITIGRATPTDYSYLATAQTMSGDNSAAEETLKRAVSLYPRSPFVLSRFAAVLFENGKIDQAESAFARAESIDWRAAVTWRALIEKGPKELSGLGALNRDYIPIMELQPHTGIYAVVTERLIRHPEERQFSAIRLPE